MVREVGFEPTNPYGTGASGLRVQDKALIGFRQSDNPSKPGNV